LPLLPGGEPTCRRACPVCGEEAQPVRPRHGRRVEEEISKKFPDLKVSRASDSDSICDSSKDYEALLGAIRQGARVQVLLGHADDRQGVWIIPNVTLVGVISGDTALALPDFRAGRGGTFQLITQVAGRAGRGGCARARRAADVFCRMIRRSGGSRSSRIF